MPPYVFDGLKGPRVNVSNSSSSWGRHEVIMAPLAVGLVIVLISARYICHFM
jgi:hypothetical protein